jgi:hypothetical protein
MKIDLHAKTLPPYPAKVLKRTAPGPGRFGENARFVDFAALAAVPDGSPSFPACCGFSLRPPGIPVLRSFLRGWLGRVWRADWKKAAFDLFVVSAAEADEVVEAVGATVGEGYAVVYP